MLKNVGYTCSFAHDSLLMHIDINKLNRLRLLEEISANEFGSQREFSKNLNISLGLVNAFIKELVNTGYCKISSAPKRRMNYKLTPKGVAEKSRLTYEYLLNSYRFYKGSQEKMLRLFSNLERSKAQNVLFIGAGEVAEIAYSIMSQTSLKLVGIIDNNKVGETFKEFIIIAASEAEELQYDKIICTESPDRMRDAIGSYQHSINEVICYLL